MARPFLADGVVRFVGEPVVAVVAESLAEAVDAAELVEVDYEPLVPVVDPEDALDNTTVLFPEAGTNVVTSIGEPGVGSLFEGCEVGGAPAGGQPARGTVPPGSAGFRGRAGPDGRLTLLRVHPDAVHGPRAAGQDSWNGREPGPCHFP